MASPIGKQGSFKIQSDDKGSSITVHISERSGVKAENLSLSTWGASFVLANLLYKFDLPSLRGQKRDTDRPLVLELGAGTGLVGLSAAALWNARTVLTDLSPVLPGLAASISLNKQLLDRHLVSCGTLDWSSPNEIGIFSPSRQVEDGQLFPQQNRPDIILAADTIYSEDHPELLVDTISTWLARSPDARVIMCYPLRMAYIDHVRDFWERMEAAGLVCLDEGRRDGDENWNELANTPYEWCIWGWKG